jgi:hypothetical protein
MVLLQIVLTNVFSLSTRFEPGTSWLRIKCATGSPPYRKDVFSNFGERASNEIGE